MNSTVLSRLFVYPVKSLTGFEVDSWDVVNKGLLHDRQWMLVDEQGKFLSQRRLSRMVLIKTAIQKENLILSAHDREDLILDLNPQIETSIKTQIWHDVCDGYKVSKQADEWLSDFLNLKCTLVYQAEQTKRVVNQNYAQASDVTYFSDGFPFLLLSQASLDDLNQQTGLDISMSRFRPNLVISGCEAYAEDKWREISIGDIHFRLPKPCSRCNVPAINPETAVTEKEPLTSLSRFRRWQKKIYFGQNALHDNTGKLQKNDRVEIQRSSTPQPPL